MAPCRAVSLEKRVGQFHTTAVALRCAMTVLVPSPFSLTCPSSRPVSGAYRVDSVVNSPVTWPVDPTDRVVGAGLLRCDARLVEDARHPNMYTIKKYPLFIVLLDDH